MIHSKLSKPCKQDSHFEVDIKTDEPEKKINWELNEEISLSSGSSAEIDICPDTKSGIRSMKTYEIMSSTSNQIDQKSKKSQKISLGRLNVSGFTPDKPVDNRNRNKVKLFKEEIESMNILKSDSKYKIGVPKECTISRQKNEDRRKLERSTMKTKSNFDLTGTVKRHWIPLNQNIDDSITKRLELIHELNQKILANYERFQAKSKKTSTVNGIKNMDNTKSILKRPDNKGQNVLLDLKQHQGHIDTEDSHKVKNRSEVKHFVEKAIVHKAQNDSLTKNGKHKISLKSLINSDTNSISGKIFSPSLNSKQDVAIHDNFSLVMKPKVQQNFMQMQNKDLKLKQESINEEEFHHADNFKEHSYYAKKSEIQVKIEQDIDKISVKSNKNSRENTGYHQEEFDSSFKQNRQHRDLAEQKIVNIESNEKKSTESTKNLEKKVLDDFNETIREFDNNQNQLDEDTKLDANGDCLHKDLCKDSYQERKENNPKNTNSQEAVNCRTDFGVEAKIGSENGWIRIQTGTESILVYLTINTIVKDICRDILLGDELSLYVQYGGEMGRRLAPHEKPLEYQDEFLKQLGYKHPSRRTRLGVDPELRHLIAFYVGPSEPNLDLIGYSQSGNIFVLKGLVSPQWKKRTLAVIGSRLFFYSGLSDLQVEWIELEGGSMCYAPSRLGKLVLRITGFPGTTQKKLQRNPEQPLYNRETLSAIHHHEIRHLYLGFHNPWDRDLWRGWLKQAIQTSQGARKLYLDKKGLSRIPSSVLAFQNIHEIDLSYNQLAVPNNNLTILKRFPELQVVKIERNQLRSIPTELLKLIGLTILDVSGNKIKQVPTEIHHLVNLKEFYLDRNEIRDLPAEVGLLKELRIISLAENLLTSLPSFLKMRALTLDVLTKNDANKFKDDKNNHNNLQKVNLRNNQLKGNIILGNYGNLTHLDVSENSIEKLDVSALQELQSARCARNSLTELTLCGKNLISLIAGHNKLKRLIIEPAPTNLKHLDISYNCLDALPEWISDLPNFRTLFASYNDLTSLPDRLLSLPLEVLDLSHNRLQALPPPRKPLNIVHLTLQGNILTTLPTTFFQNTERIKVLNLSNNRLSELTYNNQVSKNRSTFHNLEKLYLTGNCLTDTALDALTKFPALRVLHLAYNILDTLSESCIASWPDLEELILSGNRLQYLPDNVANLQHLRVLRIHSNRLLTCPSFAKTTSLMVLDLAHNQLDQVNLATLVPPQLQFLDISCNSRLHVDPRQFHVYRSQRPVSLIDVSGQNRPSLPAHPHQQEVVKGEKKLEQPWRLGFSETAGTKEKLYITQVRMPSFCNVEGLFGIFDGSTNQEAPSCLEEMIPRLILEEKTIRETSKDYLKYTLLSIYRQLKEKGQKYGVDATLIHITKLSLAPSYPCTPKKYCLKVACSGETKAVLCRAAGPLVLAPSKKTSTYRQLENAAVFPLVVPDPTFEDIILEDDDEFLIIANKKLWEVMTIQEAVREVRAEASPVLAAKRLQDLAQAYGAEDNISVIVIRLTNPNSGDLDQLMRELRHAVTKNRIQTDNNCLCPCCVPPLPHKSITSCCCHANNDRFYMNGVLKNMVNRSGQTRVGSGRYFKNSRTTENASPPHRDDRSSPSGQSDQTTDSTFKSRQSSGRAWVGSTASRAAFKNHRNTMMQDTLLVQKDDYSDRSTALSEEQFRCWEYMLEQNTHMLFDKELDTLTKLPLRRGQSRSTPHLANIPFLSKRFGSARSFDPSLPRAPIMRFSSGSRFLNGGPNAAYFGSLQRLMPYNLEYDFAVIQERGGLDSLEQDASRMQQYWGVATTEL